jgi:hypothetical protein
MIPGFSKAVKVAEEQVLLEKMNPIRPLLRRIKDYSFS